MGGINESLSLITNKKSFDTFKDNLSSEIFQEN